MGKDKKCYNCMMEVDGHAKVCPKCEAKLGRRLHSGLAEKPGFPYIKLLLVLIALGVGVKMTGYTDRLNAATANKAAAPVEITRESFTVKDAAIQKIKEKGAANLGAVGVKDVNYKDDTLLVYVDQRFSDLTELQQKQLLVIVAGEWQEAIKKDTTAVRLMQYGTDKIISELMI